MYYELVTLKRFTQLGWTAALILTLLLSPLLSKPVSAAPVRGVAGDTWADIILGKPNFETITPYNTVSNRLYLPHGVLVDTRDEENNKMYIYDAGNSRILGFDVEDCRVSEDSPWNCEPEIVIGQVDFTTSTCNGDSAYQDFPNFPAASNSTLCGLDPPQLSISEGGSGASMAVDQNGNLYVSDFFNHRVLKFDDPFNTDTIADEVWGQDDFTGVACNKGGDPNNDTLCFSWGDSNNWTAGVDIDANGDLWIVDSGNNRVLRFSESGGEISKTADLVLGQPDFESRDGGDGLNQLRDPNAVRVTSNGVYVSERFNSRVMRFTTLTNGATGEVFGSGFNSPSGVDRDPTEPDRLWISNTGDSLIELWDEAGSGTLIRQVGNGDGNIVGDVTGSVGVDSEGNVYAATGLGNYNNSVIVFDKDNPDQEDISHLMFTPSGTGNMVTNEYMASVTGVVLTDDQLIAADEGRILFWNAPNGVADLTSGQLPDGYVGAPSFTQINSGCCHLIKTDEAGHLYTFLRTEGDDLLHIRVYELPLTSGEEPLKHIELPLDVLGGGQINFDHIFQPISGLLPAPDSSYLWVSMAEQNRTIRIRDPLGENPLVDVILGQQSPTGTQCNQGAGQENPTASTLCHPGELSFDRYGNLWLSDHWLEIFGNYRLLGYNPSHFPTNNETVIYATDADYILDNMATWEPAFDFLNKLVVGFNPYYPLAPEIAPNGAWFPAMYDNPLLSDALPDNHLSDYYSMAYASSFDNQNNLLVGDLNRGKIMIYLTPFGNPAPTITEVTPVPDPTTDSTPNYTFNTTKAGTIVYGGSCSSSTTQATIGDNTITFNALSPGTYSNCTITVVDGDEQESNVLTVNEFTVEEEPEPTPSPGPSSSGGGSSGGTSPAKPPECSAQVPVGQADLFQINRVDSTATLYFTPVKDHTTRYHVMYGYTGGDQRFGSLSELVSTNTNNGVQSITIRDLNPKLTYWFTVAPVNGCAVGEWSQWMEAWRLNTRSFIFYKYLPERVKQAL